MTDKEKVIKGLECCTKGNVCFSECPYFKEAPMANGKCITALQADAFSLLKEQEQPKSVKEPLLCNNSPKAYKGICPWCNSVITLMYGQFCDMCGKAVKWNE